MSKRILLSLLTTLLLLTYGLSAYGRVPNAVRLNASSEREQDGLNGPVRRVRTETVKLSNKNGKLVEGQRVTLEVAAYDIKGAKVENLYYPVPGAAVTGKEVYKYDDKGNIIEMTLQDEKGALLSKETYSYEFDQFGNWVKMTTAVAIVENGKLTFEPTEITYRTISYYLDEATLARMSQPSTAPAAATTSTAANTGVANTAAPNTGAGSSASNTITSAPATGNQSASTPKPVAQTPAGDSSSTSKQASQPVANNKPAAATDTAKQPATQPTTQPTSAPASNTPAVVKTDTSASNKTSESKPAAEQASAPAPVVAKPLLKPVSGGVLNGKALSLPKPVYPTAARSARMNGVVVVEVVIDVNGKVISARAMSGPGLLQQAAVQAAYQAKFSPTILSGQPVKVVGTINYNFAIAQ